MATPQKEAPRESAVVVRARLPVGLERLRRTHAYSANLGVPAHLTLLYPFVDPAGLSNEVRQTLAGIAGSHAAFDYELRGMATWPDTVYVSVSPTAPFVRLHSDLQAAFPAFPIYGRRDPTFAFVPHVTVAEGRGVDDPAIPSDRAWRSLPRAARATAIEVIAQGTDDRWRLVWRVPLDRSDSRGTQPRPRSRSTRTRGARR